MKVLGARRVMKVGDRLVVSLPVESMPGQWATLLLFIPMPEGRVIKGGVKVLKVQEDRIEVVSLDHPELGDFLNTYITQFNGMVETFGWMDPHLNREQRGVWVRSICALRTICRALDAGFEPTQPPNWPHGALASFLGVIPAPVRERLDLALPIFGSSQIEVYDPNEAHFIKPRVKDPVVAGRVALEGRNFFFEIGRWDIPEDLKFLEAAPQREREATGQLGDLTDAMARLNVLTREIERLGEAPHNPRRPIQQAKWEKVSHPVAGARWESKMASGTSAPAGNWSAGLLKSMGFQS